MRSAKFGVLFLVFVVLMGVCKTSTLAADANTLYGIHWWGHTHGSPVDQTPMGMLDVPAHSAWDVETILTNSDTWWRADYFTDLYKKLYGWNVTPITRIDYTWTDTVPSPSDPKYAKWPSSVVNSIVNVLHNQAHIWIIGNEPNLLTADKSLWPNRKITPAAYARIYRDVRNAIHKRAEVGDPGPHIVLIAGPSPGPVDGGRWMSGTDWLDQVLANIPANEVDGVAIHAYAGDLNSFRSDYQGQLRVIDKHGCGSKPVWITEWNRYTNPANPDEQISAQFLRDAFADVNNWNHTAGNHNIVGMCWYIYDSNQQGNVDWQQGFSIENWKTHGFGYPDSRDLYTAFKQTVRLHYPAGKYGGGSRPGGEDKK